MPPYLLIVLFSLLLASCSNKETSGGSVSAPPPAAAAAVVTGSGATATPVAKQLALEHQISIETNDEQVPVYFKLVQDSCAQAVAEQCTVLDTSLVSGRYARASVKLRAKPAGIRAVRAALNRQGHVVLQATRAEDLATPIADNARKLKMLTDYRSQLDALMARRDLDADALIKLNRELAEVQSQVEAASGDQAHLLQRVNTEILNVAISSEPRSSFSGPIRAALADFGADLSKGIANTISATAFLLPVALVLWILVTLVRKLRARFKRSRAQRAST